MSENPEQILQNALSDETVQFFIDHIKDIADKFGMNALTPLIDDNLQPVFQGRIFYNLVEKDGEKCPFDLNLPFSEAQQDAVDKMTKQGAEFKTFFDTIGNSLAKNDDFSQLCSQYKKENPNSKNELQSFLTSQMAVRI